jgi:hypothetical protein
MKRGLGTLPAVWQLKAGAFFEARKQGGWSLGWACQGPDRSVLYDLNDAEVGVTVQII